MFNEIIDFLFKPAIAFTILVTFLVVYLIFIERSGGFSKGFLHFGPGTTPQNTVSFIGIKMDSWNKVITLYCIGFLTALINSYYNFAVSENLQSYVWQRAEKVIPFSKFGTYLILFAEPAIWQILTILQFFTTLTMQLQFILPEFLGGMLAHIPGVMRRLADKEFDPDYVIKNKKK